jgi:ketosteroid isomerase-like protein
MLPGVDADLEKVLKEFEAAAQDFSCGDPEGVKALYSHTDDVTLANPFGPAVRGWRAVSEALDFASSRFAEGDVEDFRTIAAYESADLVTVLGTEKWRAKVGGASDAEDFGLRVTTTFRREDGGWKIVHRHADPISTRDPRGPLRTA